MLLSSTILCHLSILRLVVHRVVFFVRLVSWNFVSCEIISRLPDLNNQEKSQHALLVQLSNTGCLDGNLEYKLKTGATSDWNCPCLNAVLHQMLFKLILPCLKLLLHLPPTFHFPDACIGQQPAWHHGMGLPACLAYMTRCSFSLAQFHFPVFCRVAVLAHDEWTGLVHRFREVPASIKRKPLKRFGLGTSTSWAWLATGLGNDENEYASWLASWLANMLRKFNNFCAVTIGLFFL